MTTPTIIEFHNGNWSTTAHFMCSTTNWWTSHQDLNPGIELSLRTNYTTWKLDGWPLPLVLIYHGPLQIATFSELNHLLSPQCRRWFKKYYIVDLGHFFTLRKILRAQATSANGPLLKSLPTGPKIRKSSLVAGGKPTGSETGETHRSENSPKLKGPKAQRQTKGIPWRIPPFRNLSKAVVSKFPTKKNAEGRSLHLATPAVGLITSCELHISLLHGLERILIRERHLEVYHHYMGALVDEWLPAHKFRGHLFIQLIQRQKFPSMPVKHCVVVPRHGYGFFPPHFFQKVSMDFGSHVLSDNRKPKGSKHWIHSHPRKKTLRHVVFSIFLGTKHTNTPKKNITQIIPNSIMWEETKDFQPYIF